VCVGDGNVGFVSRKAGFDLTAFQVRRVVSVLPIFLPPSALLWWYCVFVSHRLQYWRQASPASALSQPGGFTSDPTLGSTKEFFLQEKYVPSQMPAKAEAIINSRLKVSASEGGARRRSVRVIAWYDCLGNTWGKEVVQPWIRKLARLLDEVLFICYRPNGSVAIWE
jgi:hypothetical protein